MNRNIKKLHIFISYSHKNIKYKEKLLTSLLALKESYNIEEWHDGMIDAGGNINDSIKEALCKSHIVLLLITDNYLASYFCMKIELEEALNREKQKNCKVIPVMFQESVLTDSLKFFSRNRVPEDGKAIATGFKNQSLGCTHAVNMIKKTIDENFPYCKKSGSKSVKAEKGIRTSQSKRKEQKLYIELYRDGKISRIPISQNIIDLIPKYHKSVNEFRTMMDQSLISAIKRYTSLHKNINEITDKERLTQLRLYLMDICAYTKTYITENVGIKVHFRVSKDNFYLGLIASTDDDNSIDLSSDWRTKMTAIPIYNGLIYHSSKLEAPLLKSLNQKLNYKCANNDIWKDYVTFTFPKFHSGRTPLISYCISVHKDYYKIKGDMLKILAYLNFGEVVEKYIVDYCDSCTTYDKSYDLKNIFNAL